MLNLYKQKECIVNGVQKFLATLGRVLLGAVFLFSSWHEMVEYSQTEQFVTEQVARWMLASPPYGMMGAFLEELLLWLPSLIPTAIGVSLIGALLLVLGVKVRLAAGLLLLVFLPSMLLIHDFWHGDSVRQSLELHAFLKSSAVAGGLLLSLAFGKGGSAAAK